VPIVHCQELPLNNTYPKSWRKKVAKQFVDRGVQFVLGDYVDNLEIKDGCVTTRGNKSIPADLVVRLFRFLELSTSSVLLNPYLGFHARASSEHQVHQVSWRQCSDTFWPHQSSTYTASPRPPSYLVGWRCDGLGRAETSCDGACSCRSYREQLALLGYKKRARFNTRDRLRWCW
jgi:hypothetical protein